MNYKRLLRTTKDYCGLLWGYFELLMNMKDYYGY